MDRNDEETYAMIGAAMEVHSILGHGFLENVYHDALCAELALRSISFRRQVQFNIRYKGVDLDSYYMADLVCSSSIVVELKALQRLSSTETAQLLNYLKASGIQRGLLLNFGTPRLQHERRVWNFHG